MEGRRLDDEVPSEVQMAHVDRADRYVSCLFLTEMITDMVFLTAHEAAVHAARLRVELSQSKREQQEYLKNVELARVLGKRAERKRKAGEDAGQDVPPPLESAKKQRKDGRDGDGEKRVKRIKEVSETDGNNDRKLKGVLSSIF